MNSSALNSAPVGSGNSLPWIVATTIQAVRLIGVLGTGIIKRGSATGTLALATSAVVVRYLSQAMDGVLSLLADAAAAVWRKVRGAAEETLSLTFDASPAAYRVASGGADMAISYVASPRTLTAVHAEGWSSVALSCYGLGTDIPTGPAPEDRTTGAVSIVTETTEPVGIGGY